MGRPAKPKTPLGQRIIEIRGERLRVEFAAQLEVSQASLASYELGRSTPNMEFLKALVTKENIDLNWFLTGEGAMYLAEDKEQPAQTLDASLMETIVITIGEFLEQNRKIKIEPEKLWLVYMICYRKLLEIRDKFPPEQMRLMLKEELRDLLHLATR